METKQSTAGEYKTPSLSLGSSRCECAECGQFFSTTSNFERHRAGLYDTGRRCLTPADIQAKGLIRKRGVWVQNATRPEHLNV